MNEIISKAALEARKARYQPGCRVELVSMNDPYTKLKPGDRGEVTAVDSVGTVFVNWDNGSGLGVAYGADEIRLLPPTMTEKIKEQILKVRATGATNMFDAQTVQRIAFDSGYYELVDYIETDVKAYAHFIFTGESL